MVRFRTKGRATFSNSVFRAQFHYRFKHLSQGNSRLSAFCTYFEYYTSIIYSSVSVFRKVARTANYLLQSPLLSSFLTYLRNICIDHLILVIDCLTFPFFLRIAWGKYRDKPRLEISRTGDSWCEESSSRNLHQAASKAYPLKDFLT